VPYGTSLLSRAVSPMYSAAVARAVSTRVRTRMGVQAREPKPERTPRPVGRPGFGVGPIARVSASRVATEVEARPTDGAPGTTDRSVRPTRPGYPPMPVMPRGGFGLPNLRRNVCPHFFMTGSRGAIPIQAPHLLKALIRQDSNVSRCQLRGGVHMEQGFVNDVCLTARFNQCVFYEDDLSSD